MLYTPTALSVANLATVLEPAVGGEWNGYYSHTIPIKAASVALSAAATGVLTKSLGVTLLSGGTDLQVVCASAVTSSADVVITLSCKDTTSPTPADVACVATFAPVAYVDDQHHTFQRGYAVDLASAGAVKLTAISSLTSVVGGGPNQVFDIWQLPALSTDWYPMGCLTGLRFNTRERQPLLVDCQMEGGKFSKRGKSKPGQLSARIKFSGFAGGLPRFLGSEKGALMFERVCNGVITGERVVFTSAIAGSDHDVPDGEGEHIMDLTASYQEVLFFVAPQAT